MHSMARQSQCRLKEPAIWAVGVGQGEAVVALGRHGRDLQWYAAICAREGAFGAAWA